MPLRCREQTPSILERASTILGNWEYDRECQALQEFLHDLQTSSRQLYHKVQVYKWSGLLLLMLVPLTSATVSILLGLGTEDSRALGPRDSFDVHTVSFWLGAALTFMTIINSIFRPGERFRTACMIGIEVEHLIEDFLCELEEHEPNEKGLHALVRKYRARLTPYQKELIALFHPDIPGVERANQAQ